MKTLGRHIICDAWGSPSALLNDERIIRSAMEDAVDAGGVTLIDLCVHKFSPYGVTANATLAESHMAIHTWPEYEYFAADFFFCGQADPKKALDVLLSRLEAKGKEIQELTRGFCPNTHRHPSTLPHS